MSPEVALVGLEDIRAFLETLWRRRRNLKVEVTRDVARRHIRRHGLPAVRLAEGPWVATPSEVEAWFTMRLQSSTETTTNARNHQISLFPEPPR